MSASTLSCAFDALKKTVTLTGIIAVRETVTVTVVGGASLIADGLTMKVLVLGSAATTALAQCVTWTVSSANAVGSIDLNTEELVTAFDGVANIGSKQFNVLIYTTTVPAVRVNATLGIMNFPSTVTTAPTPRASFP